MEDPTIRVGTTVLPLRSTAQLAFDAPYIGPTGTETILIAEDEGALRTACRRILIKHGYTVLEAENGAEGVKVARKAARLDLVLADVMMPEMGGRRMAEIIGRMRPNARIVFMSGYVGDEIRRRELLAPGSTFLQKPFAVPSLLVLVRKALDQERALAVA